MLELNNITLTTGRRTWLDDVSLTARPRKITAVVGDRGAGKTELVRVAMGLVEATEGTVSLEGHTLGFGDRQNFGYLPDERGGYPNMKVLDQIVYLARLHGMTMAAAERNAVTLLSRLELSDRAYVPLGHLTGIEAARVDVASMLAADPDVVVIDEAFAGLDVASRALVFGLLRDHADSGVPVLITSEDAEAASEVADHLVVLDHGTKVAEGTLSELRGDAVRYRIELVSPTAASAARTRAAAVADVSEVRLDGNTVVFTASTDAVAATVLDGLDGLRAFGAHQPTLADLFEESV